MRLALAYWGLFVVSGAALLAITIELWKTTTGVRSVTRQVPSGLGAPSLSPNPVSPPPSGPSVQHSTDLHQLLIISGIALAIMAVPSIVLGLLVAGRLLRPLRTITTTARNISASNLHERLDLAGPDDELKELGETFDDLLERLDRSFQSQRQFVANAAHELRTPHATMRVWLDVAVAKPEPLPRHMIDLCARLRQELDHVDQLLNGFLVLARAQRGAVTDKTTRPLDSIVSTAVAERARAISDLGLDMVQSECPEAMVTGDGTLLSRMVENVIDNAINHNAPGGWVRIRTDVVGAVAHLVVENGGPILDEDDVQELAQPFQRLGADRTGSEEGTGLGLSIVASIAELHGGDLELHSIIGGGLQVVVALPLAPRPVAGAPA